MWHQLLLSAILAGIFALAVCGLPNAAGAAPPADQQWHGMLMEVLEGKIVAIDRFLVVQEFLVHPGARVTLNYKAVKLADLRPGDAVTVMARPASEAMAVAAVRAPQ